MPLTAPRYRIASSLAFLSVSFFPAVRSASSWMPLPSLSVHDRRCTFRFANHLSEGSSTTPPEQLHLVLLGGGHAHIQVIKALNAKARPSHWKVTVVDTQRFARYSGMVPGCVAGLYQPEQTELALVPLTEWAGATFVHGRAVDVDLEAKQLLYHDDPDDSPDDYGCGEPQAAVPPTGGTRTLSFDVLSIDIGSAARDWKTVTGAMQYSIPTRPISRLIGRLDHARQELVERSSSSVAGDDSGLGSPVPHLVVVGGGAAGLELALAVTSRWKRSLPDATCTLLNAGSKLMPQETSPAARNLLHQVVLEKGIQVRNHCVVQQVLEHSVQVFVRNRDDGSTASAIIPFTHCIWAAGAGPNALALHLQEKGRLEPHQRLAMTPDGWIRVHPTLQSTSHPFVFAAGDCASLEGPNGTPPKAGVYAVRSGPVLIENLTRYMEHLQDVRHPPHEPSLTHYEPQDDFLKLLVCGEGEAMGFRFGLALRGRWVWKLKDYIDQSFMDLFDPALLPPPPRKDDAVETGTRKYDTSQYDAAADALPRQLPSPSQAAELLNRQDDGVDYLIAWQVLRAMARDASYRDAVVSLYHLQREATVHQQLASRKEC